MRLAFRSLRASTALCGTLALLMLGGCLTVTDSRDDEAARVAALQEEYRLAQAEGRAPVVLVEDAPEVIAERARIAEIEARAAHVRTVIPPPPVIYGAERIPASSAGEYGVLYDAPVAASYPLARNVGVQPVTDDVALLVYDAGVRRRDSLFLLGEQVTYTPRRFDTRTYDRDTYTQRVGTALDLVDAAVIGAQGVAVQVVTLPDGRTVVVQPVQNAIPVSPSGAVPEVYVESRQIDPVTGLPMRSLDGATSAGLYRSQATRTGYVGTQRNTYSGQVGAYPGAIVVDGQPMMRASSVVTNPAPRTPSIAQRVTGALAPAGSNTAVANDPTRLAPGERRLSDLPNLAPTLPPARLETSGDLYAAPAYAPDNVPSTTNPTIYGDTYTEPLGPITSYQTTDYPLLNAPPADARPGECFARVYLPPQYSTTPRRVVVEDGGERIQVTAPQYATGQQRVVTQEAGEAIEVRGVGYDAQATGSGVRITPGYTTTQDVVTVREPTQRLDLIPPQYDIVTETVEVRPAQEVWKPLTSEIYGLAVRDASGELVTRLDGQTGQVLCLVEEPAEYATVERRVLRRQGDVRPVDVPGEYATVERRIPGEVSVRRVETPAQVGYVREERLVQAAEARRVNVPPQYAEIPVQTLEQRAQVGYVPVLCEVNFSNERVRQLQASLDALGLYTGPLDGMFDVSTQQAIVRYQQENGLPYGALTLETLDALGVVY